MKKLIIFIMLLLMVGVVSGASYIETHDQTFGTTTNENTYRGHCIQTKKLMSLDNITGDSAVVCTKADCITVIYEVSSCSVGATMIHLANHSLDTSVSDTVDFSSDNIILNPLKYYFVALGSLTNTPSYYQMSFNNGGGTFPDETNELTWIVSGTKTKTEDIISGVYTNNIYNIESIGVSDAQYDNTLDITLEPPYNQAYAVNGTLGWEGLNIWANAGNELNGKLYTYYSFNDSDTTDDSGNGNDATADSVTYVDGFNGKSASFGGSSNYINTGITVSGHDPFTWHFWLNKTGTLSGNENIIGTGSTGYRQNLYYTADATCSATGGYALRVMQENGNQNYRQFCWDTSWENTWINLVITHAEGGNDDDIKFYVDGELQTATTFFDNGETTDAVFTTPLNIGRWPDPLQSYISADIDDFQYYTEELTQTEVTTLYNDGDWRYPIVKKDLKLAYNSPKDYAVVDANNNTVPFTTEQTGYGYDSTSAFPYELTYLFGDTISDYTFKTITGSGAGVVGSALDFELDNTDELTIDIDQTPNNIKTITMWLNPESNGGDGGNGVPLSFYKDDNDYLMMRRLADGRFYSNVKAGGTSCQMYTAGQDWTIGSWKMYSLIGNTTGWYLYRDLTLLGSCTNHQSTPSGMTELLIGDSSDSDGRNYDGLFDNLRLYNYSFTLDDLTDEYNSGNGLSKTNYPEYLMYEITGEVNKDSTGVNNATIVGASVVDASIGKGLSLDGTNDYVDTNFGGEDMLASSGNMKWSGTMSLWVKFNDCNDNLNGGSLITRSGQRPGTVLNWNAGSECGLYSWFDDEVGSYPYGPWAIGQLTSGQWHNIVGTWDSSSASNPAGAGDGCARVYLDGIEYTHELVDNCTFDSYIDSTTGNTNFILGYDLSGTRWFLDGDIDNVIFDDRAWSQEEIESIYNNSLNLNMLLATGAAPVVAITNSTWDVTSAIALGSNSTGWNNGETITTNYDSMSFTVSTNINTNMSCMLGADASASECYQETATVATECGGLDTGSYSTITGGAWTSESNVYDGDWGTYGYGSETAVTGIMLINYVVPDGVVNATVQYKSATINSNFNIPDSCLDEVDGILQLKILSHDDINDYNQLHCKNGAGTESIYSSATGKNNHYIYEEAVYWNIMGEATGDYNYTTMLALNASYKAATTDTTDHSFTIVDDMSVGLNSLYCSFVASDGSGELAGSTSGALLINYSILPAESSCIYEGPGDWIINTNENCTVNSEYDLGGNNILINGSGYILINKTPYNYDKFKIVGLDTSNKAYVRWEIQ